MMAAFLTHVVDGMQWRVLCETFLLQHGLSMSIMFCRTNGTTQGLGESDHLLLLGMIMGLGCWSLP